MHQVIQNLRSGKLTVATVPEPMVRPGHILIANTASVISAGTEKMAIELARKSLLGKARERPDHVRRLIEKIKSEGLFQAVGQALEKLDEPASLGYSSAGTVLACGAGVTGLKPGDRAASNGPHAGVVCVPKHLCARVPDAVPAEQAAYTVLGAIALQGVRLCRTGLGDTVLVVGLGLIGQIATALLLAAGSRVIGTDPDAWKCELALKMGAETARPNLSARDARELTGGLGADAVLIAASTKSDEPATLAAEAVRKKGRIVATGAVGLNLPRRPLYFSEAEFVVSSSYGPGRYDPDYEERGRDYPAGYVRWTEQRNMQAVLDLMASGRLDLSPLTTHRFPIERAEEAYAMIDRAGERFLGIVLEYPETREPARRIELRTAPSTSAPGIAVLGAGSFARSTLLPALGRVGAFHPRILCSAGGLSASHAAEKHGFDAVTTDEDQAINDPQAQAVFVLTRHDQHARQVLKALAARKHVFVEKPLALTVEEIGQIEAALGQTILTVGFNRRFSPGAAATKDFFREKAEPLTISIRFNAGSIPPDHWTQDELVGGGRIVGEACHAIDLATFLAGAPPVRVYAEAVADDQCFITLRHRNGSISSIGYLAGGDRAYGKERVEVIGAGRVAVIDDWRELTTCADGRVSRRKLGGDKGHAGEIEAFAKAVLKGGAAPIPWEELKAVSLASILAVRSSREGMPFDV